MAVENSLTEAELQSKLRAHYAAEDEACEWKEWTNLKHHFAGQDGDDMVSYISAISNMRGGELLIGVKDKTLEIVGIQNFENHTVGNIGIHLRDKCTNFPFEGFAVDEYKTCDTEKTVWVVHIPSHLHRQPVYAHNKAWQRQGEHLIEMEPSHLNAILNEEELRSDWSANIVPGASIKDLDPKAIARARELYISKHEHLREEVEQWDDETFLNKAFITRNGKITNTAIILLGNPESESLISPAVTKLRWILKGNDGVERDYEIFSCPFLLNIDKLFAKIRNLKYRYINPGLLTLFPEEIETYDPYIIREALNNAIAHQDYKLSGMINIVEFEDKLVFSNVGSFLPCDVQKVLSADCPQEQYHNPFLVKAMVELKLVDTIGSGIRRMFSIQRKRLFPMPDYDLQNNRVQVTVYGKILNESFSLQLSKNSQLSLSEIEMLNRVQLGKNLSDAEIAILRKKKLIEGRKPHLFVSESVAAAADKMVEYIQNKALDKSMYIEFVKKLVEKNQKRGGTSKKEITQLLEDKLSQTMDPKQKENYIRNLLHRMVVDDLLISRERKYFLGSKK